MILENTAKWLVLNLIKLLRLNITVNQLEGDFVCLIVYGIIYIVNDNWALFTESHKENW